MSTAPPVLIEYIDLDNQLNDYPPGVRSAGNSDGVVVAQVQTALSGIPARVLSRFEEMNRAGFAGDSLV